MFTSSIPFMNRLFSILLFFTSGLLLGQSNAGIQELSFNEFLGYVKKHHPLVKQANLKLSEAQAALMQARGAFDPKLEAEFTEKQYSDKTYYSFFNSGFKIPTWYGIELKAAFDNSEGIYINPENTIPEPGLTSLGVSVPIGQGLLINQRMADVRKAKLLQNLNAAERDLEAIQVLYRAAVSYANWKRAFEEVALYQTYRGNAEVRQNGIRQLIALGDKPAIDSVEAGITLQSRQLNLEEAQLKLTKARLEVSNYLWLENNVPLELTDDMVPEKQLRQSLEETLQQNLFSAEMLENHPKIKALNTKLEMLRVEQKLKANMLLPQLDLSYYYLSEPDAFSNYRWEDYKIGLRFAVPLFLRKERAGLQLAKLKIQDSEYGLLFEKKQLENKIAAQQQEINSLKRQIQLNENLVNDYQKMLAAEDRLFAIGESSVFLINSRENSLVSAQINSIGLENRYFTALLNLYQTLANPQ